jgi:hypothetical protein
MDMLVFKQHNNSAQLEPGSTAAGRGKICGKAWHACSVFRVQTSPYLYGLMIVRYGKC